MRFGFHFSIGKGLEGAIEEGVKLKCDTMQIFSRNPRGWRAKPLAEDLKGFAAKAEANGITPVVAHMPYLPNLASPDEAMYFRSIEALVEEIERCQFLGVPYLVTHLGKRKEASLEEGIRRVVNALNTALQRTAQEGSGVMLLLENTAGQGSEVGTSLEELAEIVGGVKDGSRVGICIDTAHAFESGMPIHTEEGLNHTLERFGDLLGLEMLKVIHLNDSKTPFGSRVDRHWHIGDGEMGLEAFRNIIGHPALQGLPAIMETPGSGELDRKNMETVLRLRAEVST